MPDWFFLMALGLFGLVFGSFANVVIWRLPQGMSLSMPASHCPFCEEPIAWYDNIPVISWIFLRARCRNCGSSISWRYPFVELLSAGLWVAAGATWGLSLATVFGIAFFYWLLILAMIDLDTMRLPNRLVGSLGMIGVTGVAVSHMVGEWVVPLPVSGGQPWLAAAIGVVLSAGVASAVAMLYWVIRRTGGFGMGDVKLLAVIGVFLGPFGLLALFLGSLLAALYGVLAVTAKRLSLRTKFPFGPFLAAAAVIVALWGPSALDWYVGLFV